MIGKFQFLVEVWDDDPQELYSISEMGSPFSTSRLALLVRNLQRAPVFPLFYKEFRLLIRWKSDKVDPPLSHTSIL